MNVVTPFGAVSWPRLTSYVVTSSDNFLNGVSADECCTSKNKDLHEIFSPSQACCKVSSLYRIQISGCTRRLSCLNGHHCEALPFSRDISVKDSSMALGAFSVSVLPLKWSTLANLPLSVTHFGCQLGAPFVLSEVSTESSTHTRSHRWYIFQEAAT